MTSEEKQAYIRSLNDRYLYWPPLCSEFTALLVRDVDAAFCAGANLTVILASHAAIETHLRFAYGGRQPTRMSFHELIESSPVSSDLKRRLHELRTFRNRWVHVEDPRDDQHLRDEPELHDEEIEKVAISTIGVLREVLFLGYVGQST
jgi:hypothetical protein